jgi:hypothetical protein
VKLLKRRRHVVGRRCDPVSQISLLAIRQYQRLDGIDLDSQACDSNLQIDEYINESHSHEAQVFDLLISVFISGFHGFSPVVAKLNRIKGNVTKTNRIHWTERGLVGPLDARFKRASRFGRSARSACDAAGVNIIPTRCNCRGRLGNCISTCKIKVNNPVSWSYSYSSGLSVRNGKTFGVILITPSYRAPGAYVPSQLALGGFSVLPVSACQVKRLPTTCDMATLKRSKSLSLSPFSSLRLL